MPSPTGWPVWCQPAPWSDTGGIPRSSAGTSEHRRRGSMRDASNRFSLPTAAWRSQRAEERDQIGGFLAGEQEPERALVQVDDVVERGGEPVVEVRGPGGQAAQARHLEVIEIGELAGADAVAR